MAQGCVFSIEEFSIFDGPGIRKTVFLKGCPLRCNWCHNPEGLSPYPELMINKSQCVSCRKCTTDCVHENCIACGECVTKCPARLRRISGQMYEASALAERLLSDRELLISSGGGITLSGGEPLFQPEFALELIQLLKPVHTAIETSGYADRPVFQSISNSVDLVLIDLKHTDSNVHKDMTGVNNEIIIENLEWLAQSINSFIVRIPLIPGINDNLENITQSANLLRKSKNLIRVELMPFNTSAGAKYESVNKTFVPRFDVSSEPQVLTQPFESLGIRSIVL